MTKLKGLDLLKINDIELVTLGVKCTRCGHTWGIRLHGKTDLGEIPFNFFICGECIRKANIEPKEGAILIKAQ